MLASSSLCSLCTIVKELHFVHLFIIVFCPLVCTDCWLTIYCFNLFINITHDKIVEVFQCEIRRLHINNTPLLSCFGCHTEVVCGVKWEKRLKKPHKIMVNVNIIPTNTCYCHCQLFNFIFENEFLAFIFIQLWYCNTIHWNKFIIFNIKVFFNISMTPTLSWTEAVVFVFIITNVTLKQMFPNQQI